MKYLRRILTRTMIVTVMTKMKTFIRYLPILASLYFFRKCFQNNFRLKKERLKLSVKFSIRFLALFLHILPSGMHVPLMRNSLFLSFIIITCFEITINPDRTLSAARKTRNVLASDFGYITP